MQVPYLMHIPELDELWLIDGEQRFLITPKIYDLLVSNGADLPPAYGINELREQNAKLRKIVQDVALPLSIACDMHNIRCCECAFTKAKTCPVPELEEQLKELGIEANDG